MGKKIKFVVEMLKKLKKGRKPVSKGLTKAQRTTQMYNRRDEYLELLDEVIHRNPEEYEGLNTYEKYEKAHNKVLEIIRQEELKGNRLREEYDWVRGVDYVPMHGATSFEDISSFEGSPLLGSDYWNLLEDPARSWFAGRSNWRNMKK